MRKAALARHDPTMFGKAYAVCWERENGSRYAGRLGLDENRVVLKGGSNGSSVEEEIPLTEIEDVQVRCGRLSLIQKGGALLIITSLDAPGILRELADRLATSF
jgi:hypothetical protein